MIITRHNLEDIGMLLDEVHDRFFDIDKIEFKKNKSEIKLHLSENIKGPFDRILTIKGVKNFTYDDTEKIGIYDINKIVIDQKNLCITIISGFPLRIIFFVDEQFEISIEEKKVWGN